MKSRVFNFEKKEINFISRVQHLAGIKFDNFKVALSNFLCNTTMTVISYFFNSQKASEIKTTPQT